MGSVVGLNYQSLEFVMKTLRIKDRLDCLNRVRTMEQAALELFKKRESTNG